MGQRRGARAFQRRELRAAEIFVGAEQDRVNQGVGIERFACRLLQRVGQGRQEHAGVDQMIGQGRAEVGERIAGRESGSGDGETADDSPLSRRPGRLGLNLRPSCRRQNNPRKYAVKSWINSTNP